MVRGEPVNCFRRMGGVCKCTGEVLSVSEKNQEYHSDIPLSTCPPIQNRLYISIPAHRNWQIETAV